MTGLFRVLLAMGAVFFAGLVLPGRADTTPQVEIAPAPDWVKPLDADAVVIPENTKIEGGVDYVLIDCQTRMEPEAKFRHYTRRVVNEHGLEDAGEIKAQFDPSYQTFALHWLKIKRDGVWQDRIASDKFQLLRREENLESQMLDGRFSAVCHLQDLRVGDIIDYAFTVTGANPVFGGKFYDSFSTSWASPVHLFQQTLITAPHRQVAFKSFVSSIEPTVTANPDLSQFYEWKASELPAVFDESNTPSWYDTYGWVQLSEDASWKEVVDWGLGMYDFNAPLSPALQAEIDAIAKKSANPEDRAVAAIRFVQDNIRYLGIEMGANSYKPNPAALVCDHRFGDCKDKAFLCVVMLRALGIEAYPALVDTDYRQETKKMLPSPLAFDHAVVQLIVDGRTYWMDATRNAQRGKLRNLYMGDFKLALVLKPGNDALAEVKPSPEAAPQETVHDIITVKSVKDPVLFQVHTTFAGQSAESTRSDFAENSLEKVQKSYLDYYIKFYPKAKVAKPLRFQDSPDENHFEVWEEYEVPDFWTRKSPNVPWKAVFSPHIVEDAIGNPPSPQRKNPYRVEYNSDFSEDIEVRMFEDWPVDTTSADVMSPYFIYEDNPSSEKNIVHFKYRYKPLMTDILPENISDYHEQIKKLQDNLNYNLTWAPKVTPPPPKPEPYRLNWAVVGMALLVFAASCYLAFRIYMLREPEPTLPPTPDLARYDGVRGWLILVALGLVARAIFYGKSLFTDYSVAWDATPWNVLTVPGGAKYNPLWAPTLLYELAFTIFFTVLAILLFVLLVKKRKVFPRMFITLLVLTVAFKIGDVALARQIPDVVNQTNLFDRDFYGVFIQTVIWMPYMLLSRRVRATFRR